MKLELTSFTRSRHQLAYTARVASLQFSTSLWYDSVDFEELDAAYSPDTVRRICFHIVAFDLNRLVSLKPGFIDFGCFHDLVTPAFKTLWQRILAGVWAQWRYENGLPDYAGPQFCHPLATAQPPSAIAIKHRSPANLAFCGGGKDSLLALSLLREAGEEFDSFAYSHSVYGGHAEQHQLIDRLLDHTAARRRHRVWIYDDFLPLPVSTFAPEFGIRSITAAETPASAFIALPLVMAHGFQHMVLAHERSADSGNMKWDVTGETINHQWGKSFEAEQLLAGYISRNLLSNVHYFSLLKPVHDAVIFSALRQLFPAILSAHSCNLQKPWCKRCAKCAYVYLNYAAYLPEEVVHAAFNENLFGVEENLIWFRQLLGLEGHTPFECVGQVEESRLAMALCRARGLAGNALKLYQSTGAPEIDSLFAVSKNTHQIPPPLAHKVLPLLEQAAASGCDYVRSLLR